MKSSDPGLLFVGRFLITVLISMPVMDLLRFSISSYFSFGRIYFSKNSSISSTLSILLSYSCWWTWLKQLSSSSSSSLLRSFAFLCCLLWFLHFKFTPFLDLILLPLFLDESVLFVYFIYLLKEPAFSFVLKEKNRGQGRMGWTGGLGLTYIHYYV